MTADRLLALICTRVYKLITDYLSQTAQLNRPTLIRCHKKTRPE